MERSSWCALKARSRCIKKSTGRSAPVTIGASEAVINQPGVWHTADVNGTATALFITAGVGTQNRPR